MQKTTTVFQLTTTVLVFWIGVSDALKCYSCSLTSRDINIYSNCTDPAANSVWVPTCEGKSCVKSVAKCTELTMGCHSGINLYRGCVQESLDSDYCYSISYSSGKNKHTFCGCTGDKCNIGESVLKSASRVVLAPLAFVPYLTSFIGAN